MESSDFENLPANILSYSTRSILGKFLNPETKLLPNCNYAGDYRGLAEQMQFGFEDIRRFQCSDDPTRDILEEWSTQPDATIGKLIMFLENLGRYDVIQHLRPRFESDAKLHLQFTGKCGENSLQISEEKDAKLHLQFTEKCGEKSLRISEESTGYDAFISYADEDIVFTSRVVEYLESNGFKVFFRSRDLNKPSGDEKNTHFLLERCEWILVILSPDFIKSPVCEIIVKFAARFSSGGKFRKIIPIYLKPCVIPPPIKFLHRLNFTKPGIEDWTWKMLFHTMNGFTKEGRYKTQHD